MAGNGQSGGGPASAACWPSSQPFSWPPATGILSAPAPPTKQNCARKVSAWNRAPNPRNNVLPVMLSAAKHLWSRHTNHSAPEMLRCAQHDRGTWPILQVKHKSILLAGVFYMLANYSAISSFRKHQ